MKQLVPYNVLLVIAVVATGLMVLYNLSLRETFSVRVAYEMPAAPKPARNIIRLEPESGGDSEKSDLYEEYYEGYYDEDYGETSRLTSVTFPLDINRATLEELCFIPKVGNTTAQRIIQYRDELGGYTELEQLMEIKGVGEGMFERISPYLYIKTKDTGEGDSRKEAQDD